ncbi:DNA starvation/stationary phase protection protein Dps (plasmid) [Halorientalis pallida]|uniref:DNA starvation/stationary phase protection protein Dps n=1 Tax=Halorientalis pallida TaxID=2479928 RepID=UPI003C705712
MSQPQHSGQSARQPPGQQRSNRSTSTVSDASQQPTQQPVARPDLQFDGRLFQTANYLAEPVRVESIEILTHALADATVLASHARYAHWNVKGMSFFALHELFEEIAETFEEHVDALAERITALGGEALGTTRGAARRSTIPAFPPDAVTGAQFVSALAERVAVHDANLDEDIDAVTSAGDADTADLLNELSREVSQYLWFLEAHLQTQPTAQGQGSTGRQPASGRR